jgi:hypothetical protein
MSKKPRATGGGKPAAKTDADLRKKPLSLDLSDVGGPEIVVKDPDIDLGEPAQVPAEHLVDGPGDAPLPPIDLGPAHVRSASEEQNEAMLPAVLGPGVSHVARMQRIRLWVLVGLGAALLTGGLAWLLILASMRSELPPAVVAVVEGRIVLTDASGSAELEVGKRRAITADSTIEAREEEAGVSAIHLADKWTLWLKPGTKAEILSVAPDFRVRLLSGDLVAEGTSEVVWLMVSLPEPGRELRAVDAKFSVSLAAQVSLTVARGVVHTKDFRQDNLPVETGWRMVWGDGAASRPAPVDPVASMGWAGSFPQVSWIRSPGNEFLSEPAHGLPDGETRFIWQNDAGGPAMATRGLLEGPAWQTFAALNDDQRISIRFLLQKTGENEKAAVGLVFGEGVGQSYRLFYQPRPLPKIVLSRHGVAGWGPVVFPLKAPLSDRWHTLTVEVVGLLAALALDDVGFGPVELPAFNGGRVGLFVQDAEARFKSLLTKEPAPFDVTADR